MITQSREYLSKVLEPGQLAAAVRALVPLLAPGGVHRFLVQRTTPLADGSDHDRSSEDPSLLDTVCELAGERAEGVVITGTALGTPGGWFNISMGSIPRHIYVIVSARDGATVAQVLTHFEQQLGLQRMEPATKSEARALPEVAMLPVPLGTSASLSRSRRGRVWNRYGLPIILPTAATVLAGVILARCFGIAP